MSRFVLDPVAKRPVETRVGQLSLNFTDAKSGQLEWQIGSRRGSEPLQPLLSAVTPVTLSSQQASGFAGEPTIATLYRQSDFPAPYWCKLVGNAHD